MTAMSWFFSKATYIVALNVFRTSSDVAMRGTPLGDVKEDNMEFSSPGGELNKNGSFSHYRDRVFNSLSHFEGITESFERD